MVRLTSIRYAHHTEEVPVSFNKEVLGGAGLLAILLAIAAFVFTLQAQVGDVKAAQAVIQRDHEEFKKNAGLLPAMDERIKKVEGVLELLVRSKDRERETKTSEPRRGVVSTRAFKGTWQAEFRQGSRGSAVFDPIDNKSFTVTGKEEKEEGLIINGTGQLTTDGELVISYRAKSKKHPDGYNGKTVLTPVSAKLLKGYFTNDNGEFDLVTMRRQE